jgi:hypothetical protein
MTFRKKIARYVMFYLEERELEKKYYNKANVKKSN